MKEQQIVAKEEQKVRDMAVIEQVKRDHEAWLGANPGMRERLAAVARSSGASSSSDVGREVDRGERRLRKKWRRKRKRRTRLSSRAAGPRADC